MDDDGCTEWLNIVDENQDPNDGPTWSAFHSRKILMNFQGPLPPKTVIAMFPLSRDSPNSHEAMKSTIDVARY